MPSGLYWPGIVACGAKVVLPGAVNTTELPDAGNRPGPPVLWYVNRTGPVSPGAMTAVLGTSWPTKGSATAGVAHIAVRASVAPTPTAARLRWDFRGITIFLVDGFGHGRAHTSPEIIY
ncbi:hypothetical protein Cme02nite_51280 [Catellatospora methionotrophica]|uniref:Uncharacterized protein n=1 Tax=Catellatospora methionotrophica TaxID=121620 RepID=A0A8J3PIV7_9ACTN|nr:hypothetical protein Cme02nite_51280 [Catellatospora methionotrophica]